MQTPINLGRAKSLEIPFSKSGYQPEITTVLSELDIKKLCKDSRADWVLTERTDENITLNPKRFINNLVPNVVSMGLKDAVFILENAGLKVDVVGRGSVKNQSIPPGTMVRQGQKIRLEMSFTEG
jgi:cell division protein FtsI (penicillin-binding protein 3)